MAKLKKTTQAAPAAPVRVWTPPPYVPQTPISDDARQALYQDVQRHWEEQTEYYGYDLPRPEGVTLKMQAILGAVDQEKAYEARKRAVDSIQIAILSAWAKGKISGPANRVTIERRIKKTESLARMLEEKGLDDQARSQWDRVETLRIQLQGLPEGGVDIG